MKMTDKIFKINPEMVNPILEGKKTQTRIVCKIQPKFKNQRLSETVCSTNKKHEGKLRWITMANSYSIAEKYSSKYFSPPYQVGQRLWVREPWIHFVVEITNIRVERLQDISEEDTIAEGIIRLNAKLGFMDPRSCEGSVTPSAQLAFELLWKSHHKKDPAKSWQANPFVWVFEFKLIKN